MFKINKMLPRLHSDISGLKTNADISRYPLDVTAEPPLFVVQNRALTQTKPMNISVVKHLTNKLNTSMYKPAHELSLYAR